MQENNEQIHAATDAAATEHPAGEIRLPKFSSIGARALALSGLAIGVGATLLTLAEDTTIAPSILG